MFTNVNITVADQDEELTSQLEEIFDSTPVISDFRLYNCCDGNSLLEHIEYTNTDILITDLSLPNKDPYDQISTIKDKYPDIYILVLTHYDQRKFVKSVFMNGVDAYVLKKYMHDELHEALNEIYRNTPYMGKDISIGPNRKRNLNGNSMEDPFLLKHRLTNREIEILGLLKKGMSTKEIAAQLYISDQTVSVHRKNILKKFGVRNTSNLLSKVEEKSII